MKIFITGGAGFIGSATVKLLLDRGYKVTVYDNLSNGYKDLVDDKAEFVKGDLSDTQLLNKSIKGSDAVIHFASLISVPESVAKPMLYFNNNILGSVNLLEAMRNNNVKKIIFSSSAAVYGEPENVPIKEDDKKESTSPYGTFKLAFENFLSVYYKCYGINSISLRYFNAYGENERHNPETHAIPNFIMDILAKRPLKVYGNGSQVRDFVYVKDLAEAHIMALDSDIEFGYYNVGAGQGVAINELITKISKLIGHKAEINYNRPRPGDPLKLVADVSKIKKELGWQPKVDLAEGLKRTIHFFKKLKDENN